MNDQLIRDLLHEVADEVEPADRLGAIRVATAPARRRTHRGWWAAGGVGLVAASVVAALALGSGGAPLTERQGPADGPTTSPSPDDATCCDVLPVYFVGETAAGPRLVREFQQVPRPGASSALRASVQGLSLDPDYRSAWPAGTEVGSYGVADDVITVSLRGDLRARPAGTSTAEASLAVEQLVRTAQGVLGRGRLPVRLLLDEQPSSTVLGVGTVLPLDARSDLEVLSHVSLSDPFEGQVTDNDEPFVVRGAAHSFEGNVVTRIQRWEGTGVVAEQPATAGWNADRLFPFEVTFDLTDVPPGDYVVISRTDDPSGRGEVFTDTRRITVVD